MHRTLPRAAGPYRVVFSSQAWREIGLMPSERFDAFQRALDDLAEKCGRQGPAPSAQPARLSLTVEALVVHYERDDATRTLTLVEIHRPATEAP